MPEPPVVVALRLIAGRLLCVYHWLAVPVLLNATLGAVSSMLTASLAVLEVTAAPLVLVQVICPAPWLRSARGIVPLAPVIV